MDVYGNDMCYGDFRLSDYGFMLASFSTEDEEELGNDYEVIEEYIGGNPVPLYLGAKYTNKLEPTVTIIKNMCGRNYEPGFTEHECREVLRQLTGFRGYRLLQVKLDNFDELYYFFARTKSVSYKKYNGDVVAIILNLECDSQFAWSKEFDYKYEMKAGEKNVFINMSDDLYNYLLPKVTILSPTAVDELTITNITDNNWETVIKDVSANEEIMMDSKNCRLMSSHTGRYMLNDFNMHFIRFLPGRNEFTASSDCTLLLNFRVPRKVGFL